MFLSRVFASLLRGVLIAAATALLVLALLAFMQPAPVVPPATVAVDRSALADRIEALRAALRDAEAAPANAPSPAAADTIMLEAQIATVTERRDLARRQGEAVRANLAAGGDLASLSSLAAIRGSIVTSQMLTQQAALELQIATEGARLRPGHPTMRALAAQRDTLRAQIRQEAASIATALETEAAIDDAQLRTLQLRLPGPPANENGQVSPQDASTAAQRAELDQLMDAYFDVPAAGSAAAPTRELASPLNLALAALAAFLAIAVQLGLVLRRRRRARRADLAAWAADRDLQASAPNSEPEPLRQAS